MNDEERSIRLIRHNNENKVIKIVLVKRMGEVVKKYNIGVLKVRKL